MIVVGWDISSSAIGVCAMREDDHGFFVLFPVGTVHLEKWRSAVDQVRALMDRLRAEHPEEDFTHVVEERLGGFTGGRTSTQTLMALAAINAVVSQELSRSGKVMHIPPVTTKRIMGLKSVQLPDEDKKETVVRLARSCPSFPYRETKSGNWVKGTDDMADAWLLAHAGRKVLSGEAKLGQQKKTPRGSRKVGRAKGPGPVEG